MEVYTFKKRRIEWLLISMQSRLLQFLTENSLEVGFNLQRRWPELQLRSGERELLQNHQKKHPNSPPFSCENTSKISTEIGRGHETIKRSPHRQLRHNHMLMRGNRAHVLRQVCPLFLLSSGEQVSGTRGSILLLHSTVRMTTPTFSQNPHTLSLLHHPYV